MFQISKTAGNTIDSITAWFNKLVLVVLLVSVANASNANINAHADPRSEHKLTANWEVTVWMRLHVKWDIQNICNMAIISVRWPSQVTRTQMTAEPAITIEPHTGVVWLCVGELYIKQLTNSFQVASGFFSLYGFSLPNRTSQACYNYTEHNIDTLTVLHCWTVTDIVACTTDLLVIAQCTSHRSTY